MKRAAFATAVLSAMLVVGGISKGAELNSITVACTGGTVLSGPGLGNTCTTPQVPFQTIYWASARVHVDGTGVVGGAVQIQRAAPGNGPFANVGSARSCGPVLLSCEAATSHGDSFFPSFIPHQLRAVCSWSGVIAVSNSVVCEMTVATTES